MKRFFKDLHPKKRFLLILIVIYIISLPIISIVTYGILKNNAVSEAYSKGQLYLLTMVSLRSYVIEELRPLLFNELQGRFIKEGMSGAFVARSVAMKVHQKQHGYRFKLASLDPRNPMNIADEFEKGIINKFKADTKILQWQGLVTKKDGKYYVIARAGEPFAAGCLYCHSTPDRAPQEIVKEYGAIAGFNRNLGDLLDAKFVYIPVDVPLAAANKGVMIFAGLYTVFFGIVFLIINVRFTGLYNRIESDKKRIETLNTDLTELNHELEALIAERTMSLMALTVADRVRNPATVIGWTCKRMLKDEEVPVKLSESLKDLINESEKLESIVRDFEALLKSKQSMFKYEDINEIVKEVISIVKKEADEKKINISLNLPQHELKINMQKNLLKAAIFNVIRNAIEATPKGGRITISAMEEPKHIVLSISDTGTGIPRDDIEKIFDPFFSTKLYRFGMGLSLVKQIVSEHLGEIKVQSEVGKGTTFNLIFPIKWIEKK